MRDIITMLIASVILVLLIRSVLLHRGPEYVIVEITRHGNGITERMMDDDGEFNLFTSPKKFKYDDAIDALSHLHDKGRVSYEIRRVK